MSAWAEKVIEIEGVKYLASKRRVQIDKGESGEVGTDAWDLQYSLDAGETWHTRLVAAYMAARDSGKLVTIHDDVAGAGEFEAWVLALITEVQSLGVGDQLKIGRTENAFLVSREKIVLATPASAIRDVELGQEQGGGE